jgi:hypothetical protein
VNVLDENILESQRQLLRSWRVPVRQIGVELARKGLLDEEILPFLLQLSNPTFFTRDKGFANADLCHLKRCLVILEIGQHEVAHFVRQLLQHPNFDTQAKRMGAVVRVMSTGLVFMRRNSKRETRIPWPD